MADSRAAAAAPAAPPGKAAAAPAAQPAPKQGLSKKLLLAALVVLLAGGGAAFFFLSNQKKAAAADTAKQDALQKLPRFVDMDQFTVNLAEKEQEDRYMQVKFSLEVSSGETEATIKEMMPAMRSEILLVLGARQSADLATREGKEALAKDIVEASNRALEHTSAAHTVNAVRITQMIIQ